jgi:hypothetical protein
MFRAIWLQEEDEMSEMDSEEPMVEVTSGDLVCPPNGCPLDLHSW